MFDLFSDRGEPGIGGQKGDQGKTSTLFIDISYIIHRFFYRTTWCTGY